MSKNKILIIGSGKDIVKTFEYTFQNFEKEKISFRKAWKNYKIIKKKNIILVSGFHFEICEMKYSDFLIYIKDYINFLVYLKNNCKILYLVSTDLNIKISFSRVVFFYFKILKLLRKKRIKNLKVLMFDTLVGFNSNLQNKFKLVFFNIFKIKTMNFKKMKVLIKYKMDIKNFDIGFYFLKIPRKRNFDRIIRLFLDLILIKIFYKR